MGAQHSELFFVSLGETLHGASIRVLHLPALSWDADHVSAHTQPTNPSCSALCSVYARKWTPTELSAPLIVHADATLHFSVYLEGQALQSAVHRSRAAGTSLPANANTKCY